MEKKEEAFLCPFCGAPYRELIPAGVVQVKCQYCGANVLVPPRLGGVVQRCPNHPESLAIGLCSKCGGGYCDRCLHILETQYGYFYICPFCFQERKKMQTAARLFVGLFSIFFLFLFFLTGAVALGFYSAVLILTAIGIFLANPSLPTVHERIVMTEAKQKMAKSLTEKELYEKMLDTYISMYGTGHGKWLLEKKINSHTKLGISREEAIRKIAKWEGYET
jgi:DNA-directed RNA polymerase subunit RPC12/RpoP